MQSKILTSKIVKIKHNMRLTGLIMLETAQTYGHIPWSVNCRLIHFA